MPHSPARPCKKPGCPGLVRGTEQYCERHRALGKAEATARRRQSQSLYDRKKRDPAEAKFYGSVLWKKIRVRYLSQHPLCEECMRQGRSSAANEVDHVVPRRRGGSDEDDNLQALCRPCHEVKTREESRERSTVG